MMLDADIASLGPYAKRHAKALREVGLAAVRDLVFRFPYRYEDLSAAGSLAGAAPGAHASAVARVVKIANRRSFRRRMTLTEAVLEDASGTITALWFNQPYLVKTLAVGSTWSFAGKVTKTRFGMRLINPMYEKAPAGGSPGGPGPIGPYVPVYSVGNAVSQYVVRRLIKAAAPSIAGVKDPLPDRLRARYGLTPLAEAIADAHFPPDAARRDAARRRLGFDELLRLQLSVGRMRRLRMAGHAASVPFQEEATRAFVRSLPFDLTEDQRKAAWTVLKDMAKETPMHRLLDGDVGSGKTVVAAIACLNAARSGFQGALMAPTEILARQHYETFSRMFAGQGFLVALWTNSAKRSSLDGKEIVCTGKREADALRREVASGDVAVVIGTHALIEGSFSFASLALAVVDEQHRFGVRSRQLLCAKSGVPGREPHLLSMTATPIPRSLALTLFGDLDISLLRTKPAGRQEVETVVLGPKDRSAAYESVRREIAAGRQAFVVCPLIDPSDMLGATSVAEAFERLSEEEFSGIPMAQLHGKLSPQEKEEVMAGFAAGRIKVLVSTSVVEVGVDVPNATVMCVEGAERFGLAQLHQFRGRIGRGEHRSYCFLLPSALTPPVADRLRALVELRDGFALAEKDLAIRGPGDVLGVAQSGIPELSMASFSDVALIAEAKEAAESVLEADPELERHSALKGYLVEAVERAHLE